MRAWLLSLGVVGVMMAPLAHASELQTVVLGPPGDDIALKVSDQIEFGLEDDAKVLVVDRGGLQRALASDDPFEPENLAGAMERAGVDVLVRVVRVGRRRPSAVAVILHDRDGLMVDRFETAGMRSVGDGKREGKKAASRVAMVVLKWESRRAAARRKLERQKPRVREAPPPREEPAPVEEEDPIPPPPEPEREEPRRRSRVAEEEPEPRRRSRVADDEDRSSRDRRSRVVDDEKEEPSPRRSTRRRPRLDDDAPLDEEEEAIASRSRRNRPMRRSRVGALLDVEEEQEQQAKGSPIDRFVRNLYTLDQPTPYFIVSAGPELLVWSYTLMDPEFERKTTVCSPQVGVPQSLLCRPHVGGNLWMEAWPIRYFGVDAGLRMAGTMYPPARSASGRALTTPEQVPSLLGEGHLAFKGRFVFTFGPVPGASLGGRLRFGYARGAAERTRPFIAVPGYHALQVGLGPEFYLPLLWKHLSFDARGEFIPVVRYQELAGMPDGVMEAVWPTATLNNPGSSSFAMGWRLDAGVRLVIALGFFVEWRIFHEGFGAMFAGKGRRLDSTRHYITDGRVANLSFGSTLAVGWLFPQFLDVPPPLQKALKQRQQQ